MTAEQQEELRQTRVRQAERIKADLTSHKVCLICSSVSRRTTAVCPICHAYQWDESPAAVIAAVDTAATFVFPFTLGYAPSYERSYRPPFD